MTKRSKQAILVGTGISTTHYTNEIKKAADLGHPIVAYANTILFLLEELKIEPDYWIWVDPHSAKDATTEILKRKCDLKTIPVILHPMSDTTVEVLRQFIGDTDRAWVAAGGYQRHITELDEIKKRMNCKTVQTTTLKNIKCFPNNEINKPFLNKDLDNADWKDRFRNPDTIVLGSMLGSWKEKWISPQHRYVRDGYNLAENKLTSVALPIMQHLQFEEIFLVGWDGKGGDGLI